MSHCSVWTPPILQGHRFPLFLVGPFPSPMLPCEDAEYWIAPELLLQVSSSRPYAGYGYVKLCHHLYRTISKFLGFAFHPSRLALPSHVSNLLLSKGNLCKLNLLLLLEHPHAEQHGIICLIAGRRYKLDRKWRPNSSTNQISGHHWPNYIYLKLWIALVRMN